ncbi:pyridoxamine 5'-phosphate oxidase family protein [Nocardia panacis]|uniref:Pyridoxamine 5'-phosphate oxidase family protein n=1 Tax=Nocardia panacis TaxID=2340916 RepID=A0A3A4KID9_9NOCA|nr:pyridoxamine 5'-phosphate oxidase family protein [Nocardia panacis]RJO76344.1 pyridoxamine 5'-phosphate oxidase family protein [Nocardia panacis]
MPKPELDQRYSSPGARPPKWSEVEAVLVAAEMFWLSTVRGDGRPHVTPLPAIWYAGRLHIATGHGEQKAKNLAAQPHCVLTTGTDLMNSGLDVVVEGAATRVTDTETLNALAQLWKTKLNWDYRVGDGEFVMAGDVVAGVYGITPHKVLAFGKGEPFTQTRFRFESSE